MRQIEQDTHCIGIILEPLEAEALRKLANKTKKNMSEIARGMVVEALKRVKRN